MRKGGAKVRRRASQARRVGGRGGGGLSTETTTPHPHPSFPFFTFRFAPALPPAATWQQPQPPLTPNRQSGGVGRGDARGRAYSPIASHTPPLLTPPPHFLSFRPSFFS